MNHKLSVVLSSILFVLVGAVGPVIAEDTPSPTPGDSLMINWQVVPMGGTVSSSADFVLRGTTGQTAAGRTASAEYGVSQGFWQRFEPTGCCRHGIRGNVNYDPDGRIDIADLTFMVAFMFHGGEPPPCLEESDPDNTQQIDITDLVYMMEYIFQGGAAPLPCR